MKRWIWCIFLLLISFSMQSCSKNQKVETIETFIRDTNEKHKEVMQVDGNYETYSPNKNDTQFYLSNYTYDPNKQYNADIVLTRTQVLEDIDVLFDAFSTAYSLYDYFGGAEVFDKAKETILQKVSEIDSITCETLEEILFDELSFICDGHFSINKKVYGIEIPFFFREVEFIKTDKGYLSEDGKLVKTVDGYTQLDELFRPSLSKDGRIVYYPIVLEARELYDCITSEQNCTQQLLIHFSDNSTKVLTAEPYQIFTGQNEENVKFDKREGIPVISVNSFDYKKGGNKFLTSAIEVKDEKVTILDFVSNAGGYGEMGYEWLIQYAGQIIPSNSFVANQSVKLVIDQIPDAFIPHDKYLIVTTGKYTASAGEGFIDRIYNLENTIIIGENTQGAFIGLNPRRMQLPNSNISIVLASSLIITPDNQEYYRERRGFYPDLWVPASEAQDMAVQFANQIKEQMR